MSAAPDTTLVSVAPANALTGALAGVSVSACLIVKNEEAFLGGCLRSLQGQVDEIIVVDTGSTDRTLDILSEFGVSALRHRWEGDFSAARNVGLEAARSSWILYIDADERLSVPGGADLRSLIDPRAIACNVRFRPKSGFTRYLEPRLFRSDPRLRFKGRIHETMTPDIRRIAAEEGLKVASTAVEIDHLGYDGDQSHKVARDLPLLRAAVLADPDRVYYWNHLAETLAAVGDRFGALQAAASGLAAARRDLANVQAADRSLVIQTLVRLRLEAGDVVDDLIAEGLTHDPNDYGLMFLCARACLAAGQWAQALALAESLIAIDLTQLQPGRLAFDETIFGASSSEMAAVACLRLGLINEAGAWYARVAALNPADEVAHARAAAFGVPRP
jgi:glycosyltransferase involved in cell wall biosynthesis